MTTASVYYHQRTGWPDYVLIDGNEATVPQFSTEGPDAHRRVVDLACRKLGWKVMDRALIVRQADGRGTIRIEPVPPAPEPLRHGVAYVTQQSLNDHTGVLETRVAVDGKIGKRLGLAALGALDPGEDRAAREAVDEALAEIGYVRSGPLTSDQIVNDGAARWSCTADPLAETGQVDDWRDHPTLVRMDDTTAVALADLSGKLGIPADKLACAWIRREATAALYNYRRYTEPGFVAEGNKIDRWYDDGGCSIVRADTGGSVS